MPRPKTNAEQAYVRYAEVISLLHQQPGLREIIGVILAQESGPLERFSALPAEAQAVYLKDADEVLALWRERWSVD